ncbi:MAG: SPOR domain-containing protein [Bacillota bacterium]
MPRRTRSRRSRAGLIFLLVAVLAVATGGGLGGYLMKSLLGDREPPVGGVPGQNPATGGQTTPPTSGNPGTPGTTTPESRQEISLASLTVHTVQVGRFNSLDNASSLVAKLRGRGYPAEMVGSVPYRVVVGAFTDTETARQLAAKLKADGDADYNQAWATEIVTTGWKLTISGPALYVEAVINSLKALDRVLNEAHTYLAQAATGTLDRTALSSRTSQWQTSLNQAKNQLMATTPPAALKSVNDQLVDLVNQAVATLYEFSGLAQSSGNDYYLKATVGYLRLFNGFTTVANSLKAQLN